MAKKAKLPTDVNSRAKAIVDFATSDEDVPEKDEARAAGGSKGGVVACREAQPPAALGNSSDCRRGSLESGDFRVGRTAGRSEVATVEMPMRVSPTV